MKYQLEAPFRSISGVVERRRMPDGSIESLVARKDGTMYWRRKYPRRSQFGRNREMIP